jgi:hypothetical protein
MGAPMMPDALIWKKSGPFQQVSRAPLRALMG